MAGVKEREWKGGTGETGAETVEVATSFSEWKEWDRWTEVEISRWVELENLKKKWTCCSLNTMKMYGAVEDMIVFVYSIAGTMKDVVGQ